MDPEAGLAEVFTRGNRRRAAGALFTLLLVLGACAGGAAMPPATVAPAETLAALAPGFEILSARAEGGILEGEAAYASDSLRVCAFLFFPDGDARRAAIVFNHGGVSGVSEDMKRRSRDLARLGYVVAAPAYRGEGGSDGVVEVAGGEVTDVLAAARLLAASPRVDATRMALVGSSHGALVSVLAAARDTALVHCVAAACGVMDVVRWYRYLVENDFDVSDSLSVAVYGQGPEDKPEAFRVRMAVDAADRVRVPVLLQQGAKDRTVPAEQAAFMEAALREAGNADVTRVEYPELGHAFWFWEAARHSPEEMKDADRAWRDLTAFLARCLARGSLR